MFTPLPSGGICLNVIVSSFICSSYFIFCLWKHTLSGEMYLFIIKIRGLKLVLGQLLNTGHSMNWILNFFAELGVGVIVFGRWEGIFLHMRYHDCRLQQGYLYLIDFLLSWNFVSLYIYLFFQGIQATLLIWGEMSSTSSLIEDAMLLPCRDELFPNSVAWLFCLSDIFSVI